MVPVPDADMLNVPVPHLAALVPVGADGAAFMVTVLVAVASAQPPVPVTV